MKRSKTTMGRREMAGKRTLIKIGKGRRYVTRDPKGRFKTVVGVGRSLADDRRQKAKRKVKSGYGHLGDRRRGRG
jgi:hypothetical protein